MIHEQQGILKDRGRPKQTGTMPWGSLLAVGADAHDYRNILQRTSVSYFGYKAEH